MTDEELIAILDKYDSRSQTHPNYYSEKEVLSAMREACEREAKAFAEWKDGRFQQTSQKGVYDDLKEYLDHAMTPGNDFVPTYYTTDQLYLQYKKQRQ